MFKLSITAATVFIASISFIGRVLIGLILLSTPALS